MKQTRAMDTKCEKCHNSIKQIDSHTVHKEKLDCTSCHVRHVVSCTNCDFDTLVKEGKWIPIKNPSKPIYHYPAFGKPLSKEQLDKLAECIGRK
jgi:hypothetical protein